MLNTLKKKLNKKKGFTLMEMLIVVAIIAILIAIAIPTFSSQLEKARASTDQANVRSAYAVAQACILTNQDPAGAALAADTWILQKDGTFVKDESATKSKSYMLQAKTGLVVDTAPDFTSTKGNCIGIEFTEGTGADAGTFTVKVKSVTAPAT